MHDAFLSVDTPTNVPSQVVSFDLYVHDDIWMKSESRTNRDFYFWIPSLKIGIFQNFWQKSKTKGKCECVYELFSLIYSNFENDNV